MSPFISDKKQLYKKRMQYRLTFEINFLSLGSYSDTDVSYTEISDTEVSNTGVSDTEVSDTKV